MWFYRFLGPFSLLIAMATVTAAINQPSFKVDCDFGESYYPTATTVKVNGTLTSNFNNARTCHVKHDVESAIVRVAIAEFNASSNLSALYSVVLENLNVLFVGVAHSQDLGNMHKYHFHACPHDQSEKTINNLDILFFGAPANESIAVEVDLDDSVLSLDEIAEVSVRSDGLAQVKAFDIEENQVFGLLHITVSSEDPKMLCLLVVSQSCSAAQSQGLAERQTSEANQSSIKLTFTKSGRITLSQFSLPKITEGRWYIGIRSNLINREHSSMYKNVNVTVTQIDMDSKMLPTAYMCIIAIVGGIAIAVFAHFFLNSDFDKCEAPFYLQEAQVQVTRAPSMGIVNYIPEPISRSTFPIKQWVKVIFVAWFGQGIKTYPYLTGVLAISFMVGSAQFVIARWSNMIQGGNRDLCYYNELCYQPIAIADIPSNFMLSNVPYVIHGVFLALSFSFREAIAFEASQTTNKYSVQDVSRKQFTPYDYSVAYALAWALVFEGLFSATYHLCPSRLTFQFDSAFMFIISGLVVIALFNCRVRSLNFMETIGNTSKHPSETTVQAPKYFLFFVVPLLVLNYVGSVKDTEGLPPFFEVCYWIALVLWLIIMYLWTFQKVGIPCRWKWCGTNEQCWTLEAIVKWFWIILFPLCLLIIGLNQESDWSQFFLFSCVAAVALSILGLLSFDTALSFKRHKESGGDVCGGIKQRCHPRQVFKMFWRNWHRVLFMVATFIFWVFAMYFFKMKSTTRKVASPSDSRTRNEDCVLWDFFDYHDIWHMLSSFALFMSAYLLIYVTRKVEIYYWAETMYWKDKKEEPSNGRAGIAEEVVQPNEDDLLLQEAPPSSTQHVLKEQSEV